MMIVAHSHLIKTVAKTVSILMSLLLISGCDNASNGAETDTNASPTSNLADIQPWDKVLGDPDAPITMVEYASVTCGHCAQFHLGVLPKIKKEYIDTGKVRLVFREFPTAPADRAVAGFLMARCLPEERYFPMIEALFTSQGGWAFGNDPYNSLKGMATTVGLTGEQFDDCIRNQDEIKRIQGVQDYAIDKLKIEGTPSFVINGKLYPKVFTNSEEKSWENFQEIFDELAENG